MRSDSLTRFLVSIQKPGAGWWFNRVLWTLPLALAAQGALFYHAAQRMEVSVFAAVMVGLFVVLLAMWKLARICAVALFERWGATWTGYLAWSLPAVALGALGEGLCRGFGMPSSALVFFAWSSLCEWIFGIELMLELLTRSGVLKAAEDRA